MDRYERADYDYVVCEAWRTIDTGLSLNLLVPGDSNESGGYLNRCGLTTYHRFSLSAGYGNTPGTQ